MAGGPCLLGGFVLAGAIHALISVDRISQHLGRRGLTWVVKASLMGILLPLYACATSSTQIAAARIAGGQGPGVRLVCLLVGSVTNIATMHIVVRDVGRRGLNTYLTTLMIVSLAFGLATELAVDVWSVLPSGEASPGGEHPASVRWTTAIVLTLLTLNGLRVRLGWVTFPAIQS